MRASFLEATEAPLLFRVNDVDYLHRQPRKTVNTSQRSPEGMNVCDVHARPRAPQAHRQRAKMAHRGMLAGRPAECAHAAQLASSQGYRARGARRGEHRVLDDRATRLTQYGASCPLDRQRDSADRRGQRLAHAGDESREGSADAFDDGEEPGIT